MPQKAPTSPLKHLWKSLESLPTLQAVKEEWKTLLKEEFSSVEPLLTHGQGAVELPAQLQTRVV